MLPFLYMSPLLIVNTTGVPCLLPTFVAVSLLAESKFLIGEVAHKKLTDKQISDLLTKGQTGVIKGFKKKDGGKFDAILKLENGKIAFAFPPRNY